MKAFNCIAIDDEPLALVVIEQFCERRGNMTILTFTNPLEGIDVLLQSHPDIVFLDVEMDDISGLDLATKLPAGTCLIFTTAHAQYAMEGFNLDATDFLYKPFSYERFLQAIEKAERRLASQSQESPLSGTITVLREYNNVTLALADIQYIEALGNYTKIYLTSGECILSHINLKAIQDLLPPEHFIRIHRSFILSDLHVSSYTRSKVIMKPTDPEEIHGKALPIGLKYSESVQLQLKKCTRS